MLIDIIKMFYSRALALYYTVRKTIPMRPSSAQIIMTDQRIAYKFCRNVSQSLASRRVARLATYCEPGFTRIRALHAQRCESRYGV